MRLTKGYIAGPMTGCVNYNFGAFFEAEARLALAMPDVTLVNPARHDEEMGWVAVVRDGFGGILSATKREESSFTWAEALDWDLQEIETCDFIYLLPGWSKSRGACKEYAYAKGRGIDIRGAVGEIPSQPVVDQPLVGLIGFARAGKDTLAKELGYHRIAFADPLKELALYINPLIDGGALGLMPLQSLIEQVGWDKAKETAVNSPNGTRPFLQDLGVGVRLLLGQNTWVEAALAKYDPGQPTVFTDVRFPNEVEAIRGRGGVIVRVTRLSLNPPNAHVSESLVTTVEPDYEVIAPYQGLAVFPALAASLAEAIQFGATQFETEVRGPVLTAPSGFGGMPPRATGGVVAKVVGY